MLWVAFVKFVFVPGVLALCSLIWFGEIKSSYQKKKIVINNDNNLTDGVPQGPSNTVFQQLNVYLNLPQLVLLQPQNLQVSQDPETINEINQPLNSIQSKGKQRAYTALTDPMQQNEKANEMK